MLLHGPLWRRGLGFPPGRFRCWRRRGRCCTGQSPPLVATSITGDRSGEVACENHDEALPALQYVETSSSTGSPYWSGPVIVVSFKCESQIYIILLILNFP